MHTDYMTEVVVLYIFMVVTILFLQYVVELIYYLVRRFIILPKEKPDQS